MKLKNRKENKKFIMAALAVSIIAVVFVPMLYSSIYLGSVWDVYGKLDRVPVAFVNSDKSITKDGKEYAIGKKLEDSLKDNKKVAWEFVSHEEAMKGVEGTDYYAVIEVPEDFSQKIADAQDGNFKSPEIIYIGNKGRNFVFSQVSERVANSIKDEVSSSIQEEVSKALVDSLYDVKVSIKDADNGTVKLQSGTQKLLNGGSKLSNGIKDAASGSKHLENGFKQAIDAQEQLGLGASSLIEGLNQMKSSLTQNDEGISGLVSGAKGVYDGVGAIKSGTSEGSKHLSAGLNAAADGVKGVSDNINTADVLLAEAMADYKQNGTFSADDIKNIMTAQAIMDGIKNSDINKNIGNPLRNSANSMEPLVDKLGELETGAKQVSDGTALLAKGMEEAQSKAAEGTNQLIAGAIKLKDGSNQLISGLKTASEKTGELSIGLGKIEEGALTLKDGLKNANEGTIKLRNGLDEGYNKMNDNLKFNSENMSKFVSEPVTLKESSINNVSHYGEGLGPYFISLSLWLGALFISLIFSISKSLNVFKNKFMNSFKGKLIMGSVFVAVQALILSYALVKGVGINPVNMPEFYISNIFIAVVFFSIMFGVSYAIGILGAPIMFIILILQLASSGGTFPIETAPAFYGVVNKLIPMTYSVNVLRMVMSGINSSLLKHNIIVLLIFMLAFLCGGLLIRLLINLGKKDNQKLNDSVAA